MLRWDIGSFSMPDSRIVKVELEQQDLQCYSVIMQSQDIEHELFEFRGMDRQQCLKKLEDDIGDECLWAMIDGVLSTAPEYLQ